MKEFKPPQKKLDSNMTIVVMTVIAIFVIFMSFRDAKASFNERISVQGFLKNSTTPLNNTTGFPMKFIIKKNSTPIWCQTSVGNIPVISGILSQVLTGTANCSSLTNNLDSVALTHASNSDLFTIDVVVDISRDGFGGADDASFSGIDIIPTPFALSAKNAETATIATNANTATTATVALTANQLSSTLSVNAGGTGATDASSARNNLGLGSMATINTSGNATHVLYGDGSFAPLPVSPSAPVQSVAGKTGDVTLASSDITDAASANTASKIVIRDASGNFSAGTITANLSGNATNVTGTVALANGGTGATTAAAARTALGAASSGANTDITSINGNARQASILMASQTAGTTTAYTLANSPALAALSAGQTIFLRINATNTGAATVNVDGLGAKSIFSMMTGSTLAAGDLKIGTSVRLTYDGTQWLAEIPAQFYSASALNCGTSITARNSVTCPNIAASTVNAGDVVHCSPSADPGAGKVTWSVLSTAGNISIRMDCNNNTSACALTNRNWKCAVFK